MTVADFQIGMRFKVKVSHYLKYIFTVNKIQDGMVFCEDQDKHYTNFGFDDDNLKYYGDKVEILKEKV